MEMEGLGKVGLELLPGCLGQSQKRQFVMSSPDCLAFFLFFIFFLPAT